MLYVDIPTTPEFKALATLRADACVSIYLPTTTISQDTDAEQIALGNLLKEALRQLDAMSIDKRRRSAIVEEVEDLLDDGEFWRFQAHSLAVFVTPDEITTFRLPNRLQASVSVSDRFHIQPLLRAVSFPHEALVFAASQNKLRLVQVFADAAPVEVRVHDLPSDISDFAGKASVKDRAPSRRMQGSEGHNVRLRQFARAIDRALRPVLAGRDTPLILVATEPLASVLKSIISYNGLVDEIVQTNPDIISDLELAQSVRPVLDRCYAAEIDKFDALYATRENQGRATRDLSTVARAATLGAIDQLLFDIDAVAYGTVGEEDGRLELVDGPGAGSYGVIDEVAGRALMTGARVIAVRAEALPDGAQVAAVLRYPV